MLGQFVWVRLRSSKYTVSVYKACLTSCIKKNLDRKSLSQYFAHFVCREWWKMWKFLRIFINSEKSSKMRSVIRW